MASSTKRNKGLPKKATVPFSTRLDPALDKALKRYCETNGHTKTYVVNMALLKLLGLV